MKKILCTMVVLLCCMVNAFAGEIIHGIDINKVYETGDWSNKEKIKDIINDYTFVLQYKNSLLLCLQQTNQSACLNTLAENIIKHFYSYNVDHNLNDYHNYVEAVSSAYEVAYCLNKYKIPSGTMCRQMSIGQTWKEMEKYINDLLQVTEQSLLEYTFLLDYKD